MTEIKRISKIVRILDEIAFQTNLLALNTAVGEPQDGEAASDEGEAQSLYALVERMREQVNADAASLHPLAKQQDAGNRS